MLRVHLPGARIYRFRAPDQTTLLDTIVAYIGSYLILLLLGALVVLGLLPTSTSSYYTSY